MWKPRRCGCRVLRGFLFGGVFCALAATQFVAAAEQGASYRLWPSKPPADCPFEKSKDLTGIAFTGRHAEYTSADTWYTSWALDGNLYAPYTDGGVGDIVSWSGQGKDAETGQAKIVGDDPLNLRVVSLGKYPGPATPYGGRYPSACLVYNGIWYYGTYCLDHEVEPLNWEILGPFVGFRISKDYGKTWTDTRLTPSDNLFGESGKGGGKVKIGSPHFVDFGKNMEHSPDGKAYLVAHGATRPQANLSWISGDQVYMLRVIPSPENINDASKYEFFAGYDGQGKARWSRDFADIKPLIEWNGRAGCVTLTYNAPLKKYLMFITDGWPTVATMDTYLLESDNIAGPFKLVTFMEKFGEQAYFVHVPTKFLSADGRTAWLCYSANFAGRRVRVPEGSSPKLCLQEIKLLSGDVSGIPEMVRPSPR